MADCVSGAAKEFDDDVAGEPAMGGNDSNKFAPNEDEGLKGLIPPNPVCCCGIEEMDGAVVGDVLPVALLERLEKSERFEVVAVCCGARLGNGLDEPMPEPVGAEVTGLDAKDDATLAMALPADVE